MKSSTILIHLMFSSFICRRIGMENMSNGAVNYTFAIDLTDDSNVGSQEEVITLIAHSSLLFFVDGLIVITELLLAISYT
jgi:hypothetical protein